MNNDRPFLFGCSMKIAELLRPDTIVSDLQATEKSEVLNELAQTLVQVHQHLDTEDVVEVLEERERLGSTGIGDGVAIPHGKLKDIKDLLLCFGRSEEGVEFEAMDGKPAYLFFLLLAPEDSVGVHLKTLARISKLLKRSHLRQRLHEAQDAESLYQLIVDEEAQLDAD